MKHKRKLLLLIVSLLLLIFFFIINLTVGSVHIPTKVVFSYLLTHQQHQDIWYNILFKTRVPQAITALIAGASLSVAGLQMQTLFNNPLAGPSELGISAGASLGVAFLVLVSGSIGQAILIHTGLLGEAAVVVSALVGSLCVMFIIILIAQKIRGSATLLIVGVMIGYVVTAIIGVLKYLSDDEEVRSFVIWGLGSFSKIPSSRILPFAIISIVLLLASVTTVKKLNLMMLGSNYARSLGVNIKRVKVLIILCSCLLTAVTTAYCGPIIFLGLAVPHIVRMLYGEADHRTLLPASALTGALLALICLAIARFPGLEGILPVNAVTSLIGAPVVLYILLNKRNKQISI